MSGLARTIVLYRPSKGYNGGPVTSPPRNPERLARRIKENSR